MILLVLTISSVGQQKPIPETDKQRLLALYERVALLQYQRDQISQRLSEAIREYNSANQKALKDYPEGSTISIDIDKQDVVVVPKAPEKK